MKGYEEVEDSNLFGGVKLNKKLIFMAAIKRCFWTFPDNIQVTSNCENLSHCQQREYALLKMQFCGDN